MLRILASENVKYKLYFIGTQKISALVQFSAI